MTAPCVKAAMPNNPAKRPRNEEFIDVMIFKVLSIQNVLHATFCGRRQIAYRDFDEEVKHSHKQMDPILVGNRVN